VGFLGVVDDKLFQELRGYMLNYGGRYENYFSRHRVTHIICSNLPDSKVKNLRFILFPYFQINKIMKINFLYCFSPYLYSPLSLIYSS
jgi:hypothetical protein